MSDEDGNPHPQAEGPGGGADASPTHRYDAIFRNHAQLVVVADLHRRPIYMNPAGVGTLGYASPESARVATVEDLFAPGDRERGSAWLADLLDGRSRGEIELALRRGDSGATVGMRLSGFIIDDARGRPEAVALMGGALERARPPAAAGELHPEVYGLADTLPLLIASVDARGRYRWANAPHAVQFQTSVAEMVGRHIREVVGEAAYETLGPHVERALAGEEADFEVELGDPGTPQRRIVRASFVPQRGPEGAPDGFFAMAVDVTQAKTLDEELRQALADLSDLNHRKDRFLATLAHELRNPLAPLRTGLALLTQHPGARRQEEILSTMGRQLSHVVRLVNDLLDVARISRGKVALQREWLDLREVIEDAALSAQPAVEQAQHQLCLDLARAPVRLHADRARLTQVFVNLLDNAAKYTPSRGRITVSMAVRPAAESEADGGRVEVTVSDDGVGISAANLQGVFDLFAQVAQTTDAQSSGLGLGLTMVRSFVEMHGGEVSARSDGPGRGTAFTVSLPLAAAGQEDQGRTEPAAEPRGSVQRMRVLVVDDNVAAADLLSELVESMGHEVATAYDGGEALGEADRVRPELVIMDIGMPVMNGYEAARAMRRREWASGAMLVALTGYGQDMDRSRATQAGFDRHVVKPIDPEDIERLLHDAAARNVHASMARGRTRSEP